MILSFTPQLFIIPTHVETNQYTCRDVISCVLRHTHAAPKKGVADLCLYKIITMHVQMHVHNGINIFSLCSYKYV